MGTNAYANGRSIACKAASGKSICAFPDVCWSPPSPTAGPITLPYPNTGMASDIRGGSKSVKIAGKEAALKDASCFSKSTGDEAATKTLGMGVVTHQIRGKVYFNSWSMDVKIEGKNAPRMMDLATHNHASMPGNTPTWPYVDQASATRTSQHDCKADMDREKDACRDCKPNKKDGRDPCGRPPPKKHAALTKLESVPKAERTEAHVQKLRAERQKYAKKQKAYVTNKAKTNSKDPCLQARRCQLVPYKPASGQARCCHGQTPHHVVEAASFLKPGTRKQGGVLKNKKWKYDLKKAPCVCAEGFNNTTATHGLMHTYQGVRAKQLAPEGQWKMSQAAETGAASIHMVFPESKCSQSCLEQQIKAYHKQAGIKPDDKIDATPSGRTDSAQAEAAWQEYDTPAAKTAEKAKPRSMK